MEWKDITSYSRGQVDRTPTTFSAQCGPMRLVVTSGHIHYPGRWVAHCFPIFENKVLNVDSRVAAQVECASLARQWVQAASDGLSP